jgi:hydrogenase nickel incorporation protein HypA/HybF
MHESTLMDNLIKEIERIAREFNADRVISVTLQIGAISSISSEHLREHFNLAVKDTVIEHAALEIITRDDIRDPHAQDILLTGVELDGETG